MSPSNKHRKSAVYVAALLYRVRLLINMRADELNVTPAKQLRLGETALLAV